MKIKGKKIEGPNEVVIVIPRSNTADIVLRARAVLDMSPFNKMCPVPEPPQRMIAGGKMVPNLKDKGYLQQLEKHSEQRLSWIILTSLEATEELEWERVKLDDPTTWNDFRDEMRDSGFSDIEINRVISDCIGVNALNEAKIEEARERFLAGLQELIEE